VLKIVLLQNPAIASSLIAWPFKKSFIRTIIPDGGATKQHRDRETLVKRHTAIVMAIVEIASHGNIRHILTDFNDSSIRS